MRLNFGKIFQKFSKDRGMAGLIRLPEQMLSFQNSGGSLERKDYSSFAKIKLPRATIDTSLSGAIKERVSTREWANKPLELQDFANLLHLSCGSIHKALHQSASRRAQASMGKKYPTEVYVVNLKPGQLEKRVYHYDSEGHQLNGLWPLQLFEKEKIDQCISEQWSQNAACLIFVTAVTKNVVNIYGERAYRYMYLEAGAIAHMLNVIGSTGDLASVILGSTNDAVVEEILDIDGEFETLLVGIAVGKKLM